MLRRLVVVSLLVTCVGLGFPLWAGEIAAAGATSAVSIEANLCYEPSGTSCAGGVSHEFDAYLPAGVTQATPGVILIHGGGFTGGDKSDLANLGNKLAAAGITAFSINYRLDSSTVVGFPMESQDVMAAISFIRVHAASFDVDPVRLASFGTSAGATLAVYSALKAYQTDPSAEVLADVGWSGGYDFTVGDSGAVDPTQLQNVENYLGCSDPTDPTCASTTEAASAVSLVGAGEPATLLANSTDYKVGCEIVPPAQAQEMATDLSNVGVPVQLDLNNRCAHANGYVSVEFAPTLAFLEAHLNTAATTVVLPSSDASVSSSINLDATTSPGMSAVQFELSGGSLGPDNRNGHPHHLRMGGPVEHDERAQRHVCAPERLDLSRRGDCKGRSERHQPRCLAHRGQRASDYRRAHTGLWVHFVGILVAPRRVGIGQRDGRPIRAQRGALSDQIIATATATIYGWVAQWNTTSVPNGTYALQSVAAYGGGSGTSPAVSLTVANTPPTTAVLIPGSGSTLSGSSSLLDASASANVTGVRYELSGGALSDQIIATATATIYGWVAQWNTTSVPNGTYALQSVAAYGGGGSGTSPAVPVTVAN